jgi:hypothetical protein
VWRFSVIKFGLVEHENVGRGVEGSKVELELNESASKAVDV